MHSWTFSPRDMKIYVYINLYVNVHSSFAHNSKKLELAQMSLNSEKKNHSLESKIWRCQMKEKGKSREMIGI